MPFWSLFVRYYASLQVTGLGQPDLLERMSEVLAAVGGEHDRGHSSRNLEQVMAAHLGPTDMQAFRHLWRRLVQLSSAVHQKARPLKTCPQTIMWAC